MSSFLRWAGGKRWLTRLHPGIFKPDEGTYIEPFVGGGSAFFETRPERAILNDLNGELITTYQALRENHEAVERLLNVHARRHCKDYYYEIRGRKLRAPHAIAARFIYLNRTCFNGLYRVNKRGQFNVPIGSSDSVIHETDDFGVVAEVLAGAMLMSGDFAKAIERAGSGDFIYADPPYTVKHNQNNFIGYNEHIFSWDDQERLAKSLAAASGRGARVLISNADHESIRVLYNADIWHHNTVSRFSGIGSSADYRRMTTEALISNFPADLKSHDPKGR